MNLWRGRLLISSFVLAAAHDCYFGLVLYNLLYLSGLAISHAYNVHVRIIGQLQIGIDVYSQRSAWISVLRCYSDASCP